MSGKNQSPPVFNWQSTSPVTGFLPLNNNTQGKGSVPSGFLDGAMSGTNTIYSQILDLSRMDNFGLEVNYNYDATGTASGVFQVMGSNSGVYFYALTFNPALGQPAGSPGGYLVDLNQFPFKYLMLQYTNTTGTGVLIVYGQQKDLN